MVNVLLHSLMTALFVVVTEQRTIAHRHTLTGFLAGLLFAVHPIHTEAVANVTGRAELLSALCYLLALLAYFRSSHVAGPASAPVSDGPQNEGTSTFGRTRWAPLGAAVVLSVAGMLCKEQGITALGVCVAYETVFTMELRLGHRSEVHARKRVSHMKTFGF